MNNSTPFEYSGGPCIYQIKHIESGKIYIGSTIQYNVRHYSHFSKSSSCTKLRNAIQKYGAQAFSENIIEYCGKEVLIQREQYWIDLLQPFGKNGFNLAKQAKAPTLGIPRSEETKRKLSEANKGRAVSEETRKKLSAASKGKKRAPKTEEHRQNISKAKQGKKRKPHTEESKRKIGEANKNKTHLPLSEERKRKISESNKGKTRSEQTKLRMKEAWKIRKLTSKQ